jgi:hypothetical protein
MCAIVLKYARDAHNVFAREGSRPSRHWRRDVATLRPGSSSRSAHQLAGGFIPRHWMPLRRVRRHFPRRECRSPVAGYQVRTINGAPSKISALPAARRVPNLSRRWVAASIASGRTSWQAWTASRRANYCIAFDCCAQGPLGPLWLSVASAFAPNTGPNCWFSTTNNSRRNRKWDLLTIVH